MKNILRISGLILLIFSTHSCEDKPIEPVTDLDGNAYNSITIGTQTWMRENLKTTKYNDGTAIPEVTDNSEWAGLTTSAYCWDRNAACGANYNWYTVNSGKLCPTGWHVPTDSEWTTLTDWVGDKPAAKMMEAGYWRLPPPGTNETNFSARGCGGRSPSGQFAIIQNTGASWWSSTEDDINDAWSRGMGYMSSYVGRQAASKRCGYSVRCLKD